MPLLPAAFLLPYSPLFHNYVAHPRTCPTRSAVSSSVSSSSRASSIASPTISDVMSVQNAAGHTGTAEQRLKP